MARRQPGGLTDLDRYLGITTPRTRGQTYRERGRNAQGRGTSPRVPPPSPTSFWGEVPRGYIAPITRPITHRIRGRKRNPFYWVRYLWEGATRYHD